MTIMGPSAPLTVREHMTIQLAGARYRHEAQRAAHAREHLGYTETRFWQTLEALLDRPAAEAEHPALVRRLRRLRDQRRAARTQRAG